MKALVFGGTGPTGPYLVNGLVERGYDVSIMHRGTHDSDLIPASVERLIGDPHFRETLRETLGARRFDLVIATYGRIRYIADEMVGRTPRLITIGGPPSYRGMVVADGSYPPGMPIPTPEHAPRIESEEEFRFGYLIRATEDAVLGHHEAGDYEATLFRYPLVYGFAPLGGAVWPVMERVFDGRKHLVLPDGGLGLVSRGFSENMAHAVLLSVDHPAAASGQIFNCADERQFTFTQWVRLICDSLDSQLEIIGLPAEFACNSDDFFQLGAAPLHQLLDVQLVRERLGYRDLVDPIDAVRRVVEWHLTHPGPRRSGRGDPLNYEAEDAQVAAYRRFAIELAGIPVNRSEVHHPYPHPKEPGTQRDHRSR